AGSSGGETCAICLGRHAKRDVGKCRATRLWNGGHALCHRNSSGKIVDLDGQVVCLDWQRPSGCSTTNAKHVHKCS
ncbi:hypothetical protein FOMPIDRAFT_6361, partial [Fomitopsis schrenkii]